ncbi:MAG: hypothetical protein RLZZ387_4913 [Chloroflexota bacterium]
MLTDTQLRSKVDLLWEKLWTGGLSNPLDAIEQLSYLLFLKRLEDEENARQRLATMEGASFTSPIPAEMRWSYWTQLKAEDALKHLKEKVFPWFKELGEAESSFARYMATAEFKINKPSLLIEACKLLDQMQISQQNQDVQGDLYEYLLSRLNTAGRNGQFRTPRHIIRMIVRMVKPKKSDRIGDLAAGTGGFLVNAYQYILEQHTSPKILEYDAEGWPHRLVGDKLTDADNDFLQSKALRGFDNDSGMTMLRIGSMNLMLHGIRSPRFFYTDTLSKAYEEKNDYDLILMNPPFKGAIDAGDVSPTLPAGLKKTELLFLHLILRALDSGGRCAVIVPDGVLFGSSKAHVELRKKLVTQHRLDGVISMPGGVFRPYTGVSTAVLLFTKGATTSKIWYYDMEHDGFTLDDKRLPSAENDIPDLLRCWEQRGSAAFQVERQERLSMLRVELAPLKARRLTLEAEVNRLQFEAAIAPEEDTAAASALDVAKRALTTLQTQIAPLQSEINRLTRQFWVTKEQVAANKYDLSASRYRLIERDEPYHEAPGVTLERLRRLEGVMAKAMLELEELVS